jgi:hypothetical protein
MAIIDTLLITALEHVHKHTAVIGLIIGIAPMIALTGRTIVREEYATKPTIKQRLGAVTGTPLFFCMAVMKELKSEKDATTGVLLALVEPITIVVLATLPTIKCIGPLLATPTVLLETIHHLDT